MHLVFIAIHRLHHPRLSGITAEAGESKCGCTPVFLYARNLSVEYVNIRAASILGLGVNFDGSGFP